ncbi:hypothetical protein BWD11_04020 [Leptospira santarosai serovar Grippotyphosa]|nr:hypothetical protein BWD11_04020 [Leptospira santarosai serovar Grippotyphosa]
MNDRTQRTPLYGSAFRERDSQKPRSGNSLFLPMGRNKMLALCKAKMNDRTQRTPLYGSAFRE